MKPVAILAQDQPIAHSSSLGKCSPSCLALFSRFCYSMELCDMQSTPPASPSTAATSATPLAELRPLRSCSLDSAPQTINLDRLRVHTVDSLSHRGISGLRARSASKPDEGSAFAVATCEERGPRLLDRTSVHGQSKGKLKICRESTGAWNVWLRWIDDPSTPS